MKKLLTLFTLLLTVCSGAWGASVTYNFTSTSAFTDDKIDLNDYVFLSKRTGQNTVLSNNMFSIASTDDYLCVNVKSGYKITSIVYTCYSGGSEVATGKKCYGSASATYLSSSKKATNFTLTHTLSFGNTQKVSSGGKLIGDVTLDASTVHNCVSVALGKKIGSTGDNNVNFTIGKVTVNYETADIVCATPTITVDNTFNFEHKGYKVTITNNEDGSTLKVSTDGKTYTTQTSPYVTYATTTTHYYAKSVKDSYDDSEVADEIVTNTFDGEKKYIAWVYTKGYGAAGYAFATDPMVTALNSIYNVVEVNGGTSAPKADWKKADLIVCTEAMQGDKDLSNGMVSLLDGTTPMIGLKAFNYGATSDATKRWGWGTPANPSETVYGFTPKSNLYKLLDGITFENDGTIKLSTNRFNSGSQKNVVQTVEFNGDNKPTDNVIMGNIDDADTKAVMHYSATKKYFGLGLSCDCWSYYTPNAITLVKNAAAMLIAGENLTTEVANVPVTIGTSGYASYCSSYALDFSTTDVKAYTAKVDKNEVKLTKIDNVPSGEGVILYCETPGTYNIPVMTSAGAVGDNEMVGVLVRTLVEWTTDGKYNYILQQGQFNKANDGYLKANRAYLSTTYNVDAPGAKPLTIVFNDEEQGEETDGIKSVQGSGFTVNGEAYNLSGQRVGADYKGLVIINGKKVIRK